MAAQGVHLHRGGVVCAFIDSDGNGDGCNAAGRHLRLLVGLVDLVLPVAAAAGGVAVADGLLQIPHVGGQVAVAGSSHHAAHGLQAVPGDVEVLNVTPNEAAALIGALGLLIEGGVDVAPVYIHLGGHRRLHVAIAVDAVEGQQHLAADEVVVVLLHLPLEGVGVAEGGGVVAGVGVVALVCDVHGVNGHPPDGVGHNAPDGVRLLVREDVVLPESQGNGGAGAGVHVLKDVGPLLPQVNVDKGVHHAVQLADGGLKPLLHRHQPGRGPLRGGGHGAHILKVGAV